jgi:hypothetical protein
VVEVVDIQDLAVLVVDRLADLVVEVVVMLVAQALLDKDIMEAQDLEEILLMVEQVVAVRLQ